MRIKGVLAVACVLSVYAVLDVRSESIIVDFAFAKTVGQALGRRGWNVAVD